MKTVLSVIICGGNGFSWSGCFKALEFKPDAICIQVVGKTNASGFVQSLFEDTPFTSVQSSAVDYNLAFSTAQKFAKSLNFCLNSTYGIFIDQNHIIEGELPDDLD